MLVPSLLRLAMDARPPGVSPGNFLPLRAAAILLTFGLFVPASRSVAAEFVNFSAATNAASATNAALQAKLLKAVREAGYPSATACRSCHEQIYNEWRLSAHAYSAISPMFHKFEQKINDLSQGTIGTFCLRCHATVGTSLGERRELALWKSTRLAR